MEGGKKASKAEDENISGKQEKNARSGLEQKNVSETGRIQNGIQ